MSNSVLRASRARICYVATVEFAVLAYLRNHIHTLADVYDIVVVVNTEHASDLSAKLNGVPVYPIAFERKPRIGSDLKSLFKLIFFLRSHKFDLVHSIMPKTGMLGMLAAFVARVPIRIHTFTGQVWATRTGWKRFLLRLFDKMICTLSTNILADSHSQRDFLIREKVVDPNSSDVLSHGSVCGVDTSRFIADLTVRSNLRCFYGIPNYATVFLFVGRMNRDKGICDLAHAFTIVASRHKDLWLMLVGPDEEDQQSAIKDICSTYLDRVVIETYTDAPEKFMAMADVFCLPSYREGFGSVVIEAAAVGLPSIGTRIYGLTDAIIDNVTGLLYDPMSIGQLAQAMESLALDKSFREEMGSRAHDRAVSLFSREIVTSALQEYYLRIL